MADAKPKKMETLPGELPARRSGDQIAAFLRGLIPLSSDGSKKRDLIQIQWFVTVACCYLLIFDQGQINYGSATLLLLILPFGSVLVFSRLPDAAFAHRLFPPAMALVDTALFSTAIIFNRDSPWDLVLVFFFGILIAAIGENLLQIIFGCLVLSIVSLAMSPLSGKGRFEFDSDTLLRIPLLFGASLVYGYLSDQVKQEKRKRAQLEELSRQQLRMKDQFLSHVSHELRTPITAVYQFATILSDGIAGDLNEEQREYVEIILRNLKQLQAMVSDLLDATRADSGKLAIDPQMILLQAFIPQTLTLLMPGASVKGITLSADISHDLPFVYADPQRVNQILTNLVDNAMKFTAAKGQVSVRAECLQRDPGWVHVSVSDTGCGISPEAAEKIFDRLYQEERTLSSRKGLGIGLHICKELVTRHGGRIWVDSKIRVGSTFHFTLPVYSLTNLLVPLISARDHLAPVIELISVELQFDKLSLTSEPAKAAWRAAWNALKQLSDGEKGMLVLPRMATTEEQGLIFAVTAGDITIEKIATTARKGVADCVAVRHATCRIAASVALTFTGDGGVNSERHAEEMANKIFKVIPEIQTERSTAPAHAVYETAPRRNARGE